MAFRNGDKLDADIGHRLDGRVRRIGRVDGIERHLRERHLGVFRVLVKRGPGARTSLYENPEYAKVPFAQMTLDSINAADPTNPTVKPVPYVGIQFVAIPEGHSGQKFFTLDRNSPGPQKQKSPSPLLRIGTFLLYVSTWEWSG